MGLGPERVAFRTTHRGVLQIIRYRLTGNFAAQTINSHGLFGCDQRMAAFLPVFDNTGMNRPMTFQAFRGGLTDRYIRRSTFNCIPNQYADN